jgi:hypothetical protein
MTKTTTTRTVNYLGDGVTTEFPYGFEIPNSNSILVELENLATQEFTALSASAFSVSGYGVAAGGVVTYTDGVTPLSSDYRIHITRVTERTQTTSLRNQQRWYPEVAEAAWDKLTMAVQDLTEESERSLKVQKRQEAGPVLAGTAGKTLMWGTDGKQVVNGPDAADITQAQGYAEAAAASAATAAGLLAGARHVFNNVAQMVLADDLEAGETVGTVGFSNIFDGGGSEYYLVAAGTYTADGIYYINLTGSNLQAVLVHNGIVNAAQGGVIHGAEVSAALQAVWDGLVVWKDAQAVDTDIMLICSAQATLQNKVVFNRDSDGTRVDGGHLDFTGSYITAVTGGDLSDTNPMFTIRLGGTTRFGILDGAKFAACYDFYGMNGGRTYNPECLHFKGKGMRVRGASGSWELHGPKGREYIQSDAEFSDQANFTAIGLSCEDGDFHVYGENFLYCMDPVQIAENCVGIHLHSGHPTMGNPNFSAGSEPVFMVMLAGSNGGTDASATTGSKTVESGVYSWNGGYDTHGDTWAEAEFGTYPLNEGSDPWVNSPVLHAANAIKTTTGRDVYFMVVMEAGAELENFIKPGINTANGWTASTDFTEYMFPDIRTAAQAIPGRNTLCPDVILVQQGEANSADTAAVYAAKLLAVVEGFKKEDLFHPELTQVTVGGLAPGHAFLATHQTAVTTAAASVDTISYVATTSLTDVGDGVNFTGASLVTLGERHEAAVTLSNSAAGQPPFYNPTLVRSYATRRNFLHGYYLDNGLVHDHTGFLCGVDSTYVNNNRAVLTGPYWRIYATEVDQTEPPGGFVTGMSGLGSVGYVDDLENGYNWAADPFPTHDLFPAMLEGSTLVNSNPREVNLRGPAIEPVVIENALSGTLIYRYQVGAVSIDLEFDPETGEVVSNAGDFRLYKQGSTNRLLVGSGTVGVGEITGEGGKLVIYSGGSAQWESQNDGTWRPITSMTHDLGGTSRWLRAVYDGTGEKRPDHYGENETPGTTNMAVPVLDWLAALTDRNYNIASTTRSHPDIRSPVTLDISGDGAPMYRIRDVDDVALIPRNVSYTGTAFAILMNGASDGFRIKDGFVQTEAFAVTIKPAASTGGWAENGVVSGMLLEGSATTAKTALSFDGDTRNVAGIGNIVKNFQRSGDSGDGLAFAVSGDENDVPVADDENIVFGFNVVDGVAGPMFHSEDNTRRIAFTFSVGRNIDRAVQIINNYVPYLHNYIGIMAAGPADEFFRSTGTGSSKDMNLAFNLWDGAGVTGGEDYGVTLGQAATKNINLIGNIYHDVDQAIGAFQSNAEGPLNFIAEIFDTITGPCITLAADAVQANIGNCIFNGGTYGIVGSSTARTSPATLRGILVQSTNRFEGVGTDIIQKANSANIIGDKAITSPELVSNASTNDILFVAKRQGWITGVTVVLTSAGGGGTSDSTFTLYKTNGGGSTKLLDATVDRTGSLYDLDFYGSEHAELEVNKFAAGDIIRVVCDGVEDAATSFKVELDWFEFDN